MPPDDEMPPIWSEAADDAADATARILLSKASLGRVTPTPAQELAGEQALIRLAAVWFRKPGENPGPIRWDGRLIPPGQFARVYRAVRAEHREDCDGT